MLEFNATFLVSMISFIVFIIIMNAIFYKPILGVIEEREKFINDHYNDAKNSKDKAQNLLEQKEKRLNETLSESKEIQTADALKNNVKDLAETISSKILGENTTIDNIDYDYVNKVLK